MQLIQDAPAAVWKLEVVNERSQVSSYLTGLGINQHNLEEEIWGCQAMDYLISLRIENLYLNCFYCWRVLQGSKQKEKKKEVTIKSKKIMKIIIFKKYQYTIWLIRETIDS